MERLFRKQDKFRYMEKHSCETPKQASNDQDGENSPKHMSIIRCLNPSPPNTTKLRGIQRNVDVRSSGNYKTFCVFPKKQHSSSGIRNNRQNLFYPHPENYTAIQYQLPCICENSAFSVFRVISLINKKSNENVVFFTQEFSSCQVFWNLTF